MKNLMKLCVLLVVIVFAGVILESNRSDLNELRGGRPGSKSDSLGRDCVIAQPDKGSCTGITVNCSFAKGKLADVGLNCGTAEHYLSWKTCARAVPGDDGLGECEGILSEAFKKICYRKFQCKWDRRGIDVYCLPATLIATTEVKLRNSANCNIYH